MQHRIEAYGASQASCQHHYLKIKLRMIDNPMMTPGPWWSFIAGPQVWA